MFTKNNGIWRLDWPKLSQNCESFAEYRRNDNNSYSLLCKIDEVSPLLRVYFAVLLSSINCKSTSMAFRKCDKCDILEPIEYYEQKFYALCCRCRKYSPNIQQYDCIYVYNINLMIDTLNITDIAVQICGKVISYYIAGTFKILGKFLNHYCELRHCPLCYADDCANICDAALIRYTFDRVIHIIFLCKNFDLELIEICDIRDVISKMYFDIMYETIFSAE